MGINDLTLAKNLTAMVEKVTEGLEQGTAPILNQVTETTPD